MSKSFEFHYEYHTNVGDVLQILQQDVGKK